MTFDAANGYVILFGGNSDDGYAVPSSETWTYDGSDWTQLSPATTPTRRRDGAIAYDEANGNTVMYGGVDSNGITLSILSDTVVWAGGDWTVLAPALSPSPSRVHSGFAYSPDCGAMILACGQLSTGSATDETWEWDGSDWTQAAPLGTPGARIDFGFTKDPLDDFMFLFGGTNTVFSALYDDSWNFYCSAAPGSDNPFLETDFSTV